MTFSASFSKTFSSFTTSGHVVALVDTIQMFTKFSKRRYLYSGLALSGSVCHVIQVVTNIVTEFIFE